MVSIPANGCHRRTPDDIVEDSVTEEFVSKYVRPRSDPVAALAHEGSNIPPDLLVANRIVLVEVIPRGGNSRIIFEDDARRPPFDGTTSRARNARKIGLSYPACLSQPEIEVRVNYECDVGNFVAVHVVVPNPVLLEARRSSGP